jgi:hypothetical protein
MGKKKSKARSASGAVVVSAADIKKACLAGDLIKLRRWRRQGVRVTSAEPLLIAIKDGKVDLMRCLVNDLGADVNQAREDGASFLHIAPQIGNVDLIRCITLVFGADVNQTDANGAKPLYLVRCSTEQPPGCPAVPLE